MAPIFEQAALGAFAPCQLVERGSIVGPKPREGRQIMGAGKDVDAVDLMKRQPFDRRQQVPRGWALRSRRRKALRRKRNAPGLCPGDVI